MKVPEVKENSQKGMQVDWTRLCESADLVLYVSSDHL